MRSGLWSPERRRRSKPNTPLNSTGFNEVRAVEPGKTSATAFVNCAYGSASMRSGLWSPERPGAKLTKKAAEAAALQ